MSHLSGELLLDGLRSAAAVALAAPATCMQLCTERKAYRDMHVQKHHLLQT